MSYEADQRHLLALWEVSVSEDVTTNVECDISDEDAPSEHSRHDTDSEQSDSEIEREDSSNTATISTNNIACYIGKDGQTKWLKHKITTHTKIRSKNIVTKLPGVRNIAKNAKTYMDCWKLFFPDEIISHIVECTNVQLNIMRATYQRDRDCLPTDFD